MSAIKCNVILNSVRTRRDNSLSLSLETPELTDEHMLVFLKLRNVNLDMTLEVLGQTEAPMEVKNTIDSKSLSERLRNCIYVWFKSEQEMKRVGPDTSFELFRTQKMEILIDFVKAKLPKKD